ncbi:TetR family transcriptional regulator [Ectothiorhodospiraceae bacterium WFHF3C12]|nr:TetR family transcriptional regulator [Ectothiorhodospiraceae bacterium WFHF3C12]
MAKSRQATNREPLAAERIHEAALALAEDAGVESLSMRKLAASLGVDAMSIYHHVANKQALLMGMFETVLEELRLPDDPQLSWQAALRELATRFFRLAQRYPRVFPHLIASPYATRRELEIHRYIRETLDQAGLAEGDRATATAAIYTYAQGIAGVAINGLAVRPVYDPDTGPAETAQHCSAAEKDFVFSVDLLIAGIEARAERSALP